LDELDMSYRTGNALVEPLKLRESLNLLRDLLFEQLRNRERKMYVKKDNRSDKTGDGSCC
ncbi:hypothetical protein WDW89_08565, partial [Deltaproteobacteria bacterium TL4]